MQTVLSPKYDSGESFREKPVLNEARALFDFGDLPAGVEVRGMYILVRPMLGHKSILQVNFPSALVDSTDTGSAESQITKGQQKQSSRNDSGVKISGPDLGFEYESLESGKGWRVTYHTQLRTLAVGGRGGPVRVANVEMGGTALPLSWSGRFQRGLLPWMLWLGKDRKAPLPPIETGGITLKSCVKTNVDVSTLWIVAIARQIAVYLCNRSVLTVPGTVSVPQRSDDLLELYNEWKEQDLQPEARGDFKAPMPVRVQCHGLGMVDVNLVVEYELQCCAYPEDAVQPINTRLVFPVAAILNKQTFVLKLRFDGQQVPSLKVHINSVGEGGYYAEVDSGGNVVLREEFMTWVAEQLSDQALAETKEVEIWFSTSAPHAVQGKVVEMSSLSNDRFLPLISSVDEASKAFGQLVRELWTWYVEGFGVLVSTLIDLLKIICKYPIDRGARLWVWLSKSCSQKFKSLLQKGACGVGLLGKMIFIAGYFVVLDIVIWPDGNILMDKIVSQVPYLKELDPKVVSSGVLILMIPLLVAACGSLISFFSFIFPAEGSVRKNHNDLATKRFQPVKEAWKKFIKHITSGG
ncbi:hypothetical protein [Desulfosediminicola flagellatus]|uniref:hypothetical protein n=1 Tax=Desulfosediminicola flagellatus TaxID=2569541 RepID=UPI0010AC703E|nr:hypothetical protein [Desulfosediminicola flagellatus]